MQCVAGLVAHAAQEPIGVTIVTEEPKVTVNMGIKMAPSNEQGDSIEWWERREEGYKRFMRAKALFPRARSVMIETYLASLAHGFTKTLVQVPRTRFHFYVADTLNPSIWPAGGGFFIIHAGLIRQVKDERQFAFILALELAHETLGHNMVRSLIKGKNWEPGSWSDGNYDSWPVEFWAQIVGHDPIERGGFTYSLQQESDALELVYRFFMANAWEYDGIGRLVADLLPSLNAIPGASSLQRLHENLAQSLRLPHLRPHAEILPVDSLVSRASYSSALAEIQKSTLQRYGWMLELVPYRDFILAKTQDLDRIRNQFNEHSDRFSSILAQAKLHPREKSLETELADFADTKENLDSRIDLRDAKLARTYLLGTLYLAHGKWQEAIDNANAGLKLDPQAEPFLWQRARARMQLRQFNKNIVELSNVWKNFDHRRELFLLESNFLEGRYTDAAAQAIEYRKKYPFDIDGAFWCALSFIRLRRPAEAANMISEIEAFWGDRPMARALKIFHYALQGKHTLAHAAFDLNSDIHYTAQEWGILEFAQAWFRESYSGFPNDNTSSKLYELAELEWPLASVLRLNLARDPVEVR